MDTQIQPLPLLDGDKTLISLLSLESYHWWGHILTRWRAITRRGNTLHLYFYGPCLDVEYIEHKTESSIIHSFANVPPALSVAEVLRLLGLSMQGKEESAA